MVKLQMKDGVITTGSDLAEKIKQQFTDLQTCTVMQALLFLSQQ